MRQARCNEVFRLRYCDLLRLLYGMLRRFFLRRVLRLPHDQLLREEARTERAQAVSEGF
jgi:hypothetical protein